MAIRKRKDSSTATVVAKQKFLTFHIAEEFFGIALEPTREVLEYGDVTEVPLMPPFMRGVINLRGEVVPVIDLAVRLGRPPIEAHKRTCIIVVELPVDDGEHVIGLMADTVNEVVAIPSADIEGAPAFGAKIRAEFIQGVAKHDGKFVIILDVNNTLSPRELAKLVEAELE